MRALIFFALTQFNIITGKMDNPMNVQTDEPTKIRRPRRWAQKDEKGPERADFGAYCTQEAVMPRKLASWTHNCKYGYILWRAQASLS